MRFGSFLIRLNIFKRSQKPKESTSTRSHQKCHRSTWKTISTIQEWTTWSVILKLSRQTTDMQVAAAPTTTRDFRHSQQTKKDTESFNSIVSFKKKYCESRHFWRISSKMENDYDKNFCSFKSKLEKKVLKLNFRYCFVLKFPNQT